MAKLVNYANSFLFPLQFSINRQSEQRSFTLRLHGWDSTMAEKNKILIADDNQANCELLEAYLAEVDCQIEIAYDGQETVDKIASFQPDLILLDIMMPKFSGFEICKQIKEDATSRSIMVLMVTALNETGDIERAVAAGTDDFLSKPVNKVELLKRVENMLRLKDIRDENERLRRYIEEMDDDRETDDDRGAS